MGAMKVWDGSSWQSVAPFSERASVYVGPTAPAGTAYAGDMWWDTDEPAPGVPGQELAYNQVTSAVYITATSAAVASVVVEGTARSYDGSPILVEFYCGAFQPPSGPAGVQAVLNLWDGATDLGHFGTVGNPAAAFMCAPARLTRRIVPTVGTHTYRVLGWVQSGQATAHCGPGGLGVWSPMFVRVTRV